MPEAIVIQRLPLAFSYFASAVNFKINNWNSNSLSIWPVFHAVIIFQLIHHKVFLIETIQIVGLVVTLT